MLWFRLPILSSPHVVIQITSSRKSVIKFPLFFHQYGNRSYPVNKQRKFYYFVTFHHVEIHILPLIAVESMFKSDPEPNPPSCIQILLPGSGNLFSNKLPVFRYYMVSRILLCFVLMKKLVSSKNHTK